MRIVAQMASHLPESRGSGGIRHRGCPSTRLHARAGILAHFSEMKTFPRRSAFAYSVEGSGHGFLAEAASTGDSWKRADSIPCCPPREGKSRRSPRPLPHFPGNFVTAGRARLESCGLAGFSVSFSVCGVGYVRLPRLDLNKPKPPFPCRVWLLCFPPRGVLRG